MSKDINYKYKLDIIIWLGYLVYKFHRYENMPWYTFLLPWWVSRGCCWTFLGERPIPDGDDKGEDDHYQWQVDGFTQLRRKSLDQAHVKTRLVKKDLLKYSRKNLLDNFNLGSIIKYWK
jgi:hypothetical protein